MDKTLNNRQIQLKHLILNKTNTMIVKGPKYNITYIHTVHDSYNCKSPAHKSSCFSVKQFSSAHTPQGILLRINKTEAILLTLFFDTQLGHNNTLTMLI